MPFRIRTDADKWFSEVEGKEPFKIDFDLYYFCLMVGLSATRRTDPKTIGVPTRELVNDFPQDYKQSQRLIIGLLVTAELKKGGIDLQEKSAVRGVFKRLVAADNSSGLTPGGMETMNAYASGGFDVMAEARDTRPSSAQEFLRDYVNLIGDVLKE